MLILFTSEGPGPQTGPEHPLRSERLALLEHARRPQGRIEPGRAQYLAGPGAVDPLSFPRDLLGSPPDQLGHLFALDHHHAVGNPELQLEPVVDAGMNLFEGLAANKIDLAILPGTFWGEAYKTVEVGRMENLWMASPTLALPDRSLRPEEFAQYPVLEQSIGSAKNTFYGAWRQGAWIPVQEGICHQQPDRIESTDHRRTRHQPACPGLLRHVYRARAPARGEERPHATAAGLFRHAPGRCLQCGAGCHC